MKNQPGFTPPFETKSRSLSLSIFLLGIAVLLAVFFHISIYFKNQSLEQMDIKIQEYKDQTASLISPALEQMEKSQSVITQVSKNRIVWSELVRDLLSTLPAGVVISSLNGDSTGKISANMSTNDIKNVSRTIELLSISSVFRDSFVPSLSAGISATETQVNFPILIDLSKKNANQNANGSDQANDNQNS